MADQEQLALIQTGVNAWNEWRQMQRVKPDLSGINLSELDLRLIDLTRADLSGTNLSRTLLNGAYLKGADLSKCSLIEADLGDADLLLAIHHCPSGTSGFGSGSERVAIEIRAAQRDEQLILAHVPIISNSGPAC